MLFALVAVTAVLGSSKLRGAISLVLGLAIGIVGIDFLTGQPRATFGIPSCPTASTSWSSRWPSSPSARRCGWPRTCAGARRRHPGRPAVDGPRRLAAVVEAVAAWHRLRLPVRRAARRRRRAADVPELHHRKKLSKHPEEFGRAPSRASQDPEAANNASAAGTLVPMLSLGLPTNATAAVMLTAFVSYGIQPGPTLFEKEPLLIWTLIASLFIGNLLLLVLNLPLAPLWAKLLRTPRPYLYAGILFFATLGAFAVNIQPLDLALLLVFGLLGLMMRRFGLPILPLIIGVILGPRIERQLRQSLQLGGGDGAACSPSRSRSSPTCCMAILLIIPLMLRLMHRDEETLLDRRGRQGPEREGAQA